MTSDMETKEKKSGPPPPKKLKQATLSFKVLTPKPVAPQVNQSPTGKKRKLSESSQQNTKAPKAAKNEDKKKPHRHEDEENEVSSSSEAETLAKISDSVTTEKPKSFGLIDRFVKSVPTQQEEVSTSCEEGILVDLTEDADDEPVSSEVVQDHEDAKENEATSNSAKKLCVKPKLVVQSPDEEIAKEKECDDTEKSKNKLCVVPVEETDETPKKRLRQSSNDLKVTPSTKTNEEIPASGEKRKIKTPVSEKKEEERKKKAEEKEKQRLEKLAQKQKEKDEKEKKRLEEKERKEKEKMEAKLKKEEEKKEKERQKEKEREEKMKLKEEERKKKQEIIEAKNEEKRKKEEEKKRKEEEKKQQEEEKLKIEEEKKQLEEEKKKKFQSFFTKSTKTSPPPKPQQSRGPFMAFEPKKNQKLAPTCRVVLDNQRKTLLISEMEKQDDTNTYVDELKNKKRVPGQSGKTWPWSRQNEDVDDVICTDPVPATEKKKKQYHMKAKFLQFSENHRPAYYGTWRKKSKKLNARKPLAKDEEIFDYSVDSDEEWEEEEPGESVSDSEGEDEEDKGEDEEEDEDEFIVPHGYLSEGEGCEDEEDDANPEKMKARQLAKAKAWEMEMKNSKTEVLKMLAIGCNWWRPDEKVADFHTETLDLFRVVPLVASLPISTQSKSTSPSAGGQSAKQKKSKEAKRKSLIIPEEALPDIIRLVHGNMYSIQKFYKEFKEFWKRKHSDQGKTGESTESKEVDSQQDIEKQDKSSTPSPAPTKSSPDAQSCETESNIPGISKRAFELKIRAIAAFEKRDNFKKSRWFVHQEVLEKYNLTDLPVPNEWNWLTKSTKDSAKKTETPDGSKIDNQEKKSGRTTPSIAQFAKPGVTPSLHSTTPTSALSMKSPSSNSGFVTPPISAETPKRVEKTITPSVLFKHKKKNVQSVEKTPTCMDVSDCIVIEEDSPILKPLPKVAEKGQRTLVNMLSKKSKPAEKVVPVPIEIDLT